MEEDDDDDDETAETFSLPQKNAVYFDVHWVVTFPSLIAHVTKSRNFSVWTSLVVNGSSFHHCFICNLLYQTCCVPQADRSKFHLIVVDGQTTSCYQCDISLRTLFIGHLQSVIHQTELGCSVLSSLSFTLHLTSSDECCSLGKFSHKQACPTIKVDLKLIQLQVTLLSLNFIVCIYFFAYIALKK